jgi:hypothetical protein
MAEGRRGEGRQGDRGWSLNRISVGGVSRKFQCSAAVNEDSAGICSDIQYDSAVVKLDTEASPAEAT